MAVTVSFDLISAQANFQHVFTTGTNQFGVEGTITPVPLPAALPLFASALGALGFAAWRKKRKAALAAA
jgi:hypothetical protein